MVAVGSSRVALAAVATAWRPGGHRGRLQVLRWRFLSTPFFWHRRWLMKPRSDAATAWRRGRHRVSVAVANTADFVARLTVPGSCWSRSPVTRNGRRRRVGQRETVSARWRKGGGNGGCNSGSSCVTSFAYREPHLRVRHAPSSQGRSHRFRRRCFRCRRFTYRRPCAPPCRRSRCS